MEKTGISVLILMEKMDYEAFENFMLFGTKSPSNENSGNIAGDTSNKKNQNYRIKEDCPSVHMNKYLKIEKEPAEKNPDQSSQWKYYDVPEIGDAHEILNRGENIEEKNGSVKYTDYDQDIYSEESSKKTCFACFYYSGIGDGVPEAARSVIKFMEKMKAEGDNLEIIGDQVSKYFKYHVYNQLNEMGCHVEPWYKETIMDHLANPSNHILTEDTLKYSDILKFSAVQKVLFDRVLKEQGNGLGIFCCSRTLKDLCSVTDILKKLMDGRGLKKMGGGK